MTVVVLLLIDHLLDLLKERRLMKTLVLGEGQEYGSSSLKFYVTINIFLIEFLHDSLFQFWALNISVGESEKDGLKGGSMVSIESLNPLNGDRSDNTVEMIIYDKIMTADLVVDSGDVTV